MMNGKFTDFKSFYAFYLEEHSKLGTKILHVLGTLFFMGFLMVILFKGWWSLLLVCIISPYCFAWVGHFFIEKNKPAAFSQPIYSLMGDFLMCFELITGKRAWRE